MIESVPARLLPHAQGGQRVSNDYVTERLKQWALCQQTEPHDPSRPSESLEYRMMTGEAFVRSGRKYAGGDGGLINAVTAGRSHLREADRAREIYAALRTLKRRNAAAHDVLVEAFMARPGHVLSRRSGAKRHEISERKWRDLFNIGLWFIDARLATAT